ncbi:phosphate acetyltransferase [Lactobacillus xylocopicola]|uniref:Phosphate acetyltransferase n=1 Tax=Lactobacillus xylocopicola TaxID=2976676 RepID=A0ABM8BG86_9LACO|nr:phosphate acetyltransferase [Lactobacillus xylocopicola]BDR60277.1 phosphate acetyltransferase [Lactobacillus xylocopicola]
MSIFEVLKSKLNDAPQKLRIVFPESEDIRVLRAVQRLVAENLLEPVLLGQPKRVKEIARQAGLNLDKIIIVQPDADDRMVAAFGQARGKRISEEEVRTALRDDNYFGTMMVQMGDADGMVSGATRSTAATVRPALQLIHAAQGMKRISGGFIMERGEEQYVFADCAINLDPDSQTLAEIAYQSVQTARMIDLEPRVAFLSFSTKGSAKGEMVDKVVKASELFKQNHPEIIADGELQFDAAFVPEVAAAKSSQSPLKGRANVFIFPELQSGNIAYKITQRLGNFTAIGPILQGIAQPINDLSRGASSEDIYDIAILTAAQALVGR